MQIQSSNLMSYKPVLNKKTYKSTESNLLNLVCIQTHKQYWIILSEIEIYSSFIL